MQPSPLNINKIKEFLNGTNDISGFLYSAKKFCDSVVNKTDSSLKD